MLLTNNSNNWKSYLLPLSSYNEDPTKPVQYHPTRMRWRGDVLLNFIVSETILDSNPGLDAGQLTKLRASIISTRNLAICFNDMGWDVLCPWASTERQQGESFEHIIGLVSTRGIEDPNDVCRFNCRVKGDLRVRLQDDDPTVVFLNECIYLRDHSVDNVKFPRWNFFFAENFSDLVRGVNVDRLLMEEIRTRCAHPSPRELLVASYLSKMDRFYGLPFYERLLSWTVAQCEFPLRSWLGLRVMPDSLTLKALSEFETRSGIEEPDSIRQDIDRQVDVWLAGEELGYAAGLLLLASECSHSKPIVRQVIKHARAQNRSWRRAGRAASQSDFYDPSIKSFTQTLISAFDDGYSRAAQELEQQRNQMTLASSEPDMVPDDFAPPAVADTEPVVRTTLAKAVLADNDADPFGLAHKVAKAAIALRNSPNWSKLTDEQRAYANRAFEALFNTQLCSKDEPVA